jgi:hypothetical protein
MLFDDLARGSDKRTQSDILIMDFAKAFDKVPHRRLINKLQWYGVKGKTVQWIESFLSNRSQCVVIDGQKSSSVPVTSGVPQGTVLGPALFLAYINDLPEYVNHSHVRLFADDCIIYRDIASDADCEKLQSDLDGLARWEETWLMEFHPSKCFKMKLTHSKKQFNKDYFLHGTILSEVESSTYLGVKLSSDLKWDKHISGICGKANSTLGLLRRNLKTKSKTLKDRAYQALVRPKLEYASSVWDHMGSYRGRNVGVNNAQNLERIQRRAARYVSNDWSREHSVSAMIEYLGWDSLQTRRCKYRLCMLFKIINGLVAISPVNYLVPKYAGLRSGGGGYYRQVSAKKDVYLCSFFPRTITQWNTLPAELVQCQSLDAFKGGLAKITV